VTDQLTNIQDFQTALEKRQIKTNSLLCLGLDPDLDNEKFPKKIKRQYGETPKALYEFCLMILGQTSQYLSVVKINTAFFEKYGSPGWIAIKNLIETIKKEYPGLPIILDGKRGDIGNTNRKYEQMFEHTNADAITVSPYLGIAGENALDPFLKKTGKGVIILCHTSNPEAKLTQDVIVKTKKFGEIPYYLYIAHLAEEARKVNSNVLIVVGATMPKQLKKAHEVFKGTILVPALGKSQGGRPEDLVGAFDQGQRGVIASLSRQILFAENPKEEARKWRDEINSIRAAEKLRSLKLKAKLDPKVRKILNGMSATTIKLAEMILTDKVTGKLTRRYGKPGSYEYKIDKGEFPMLSIANDPEHEFAGAANTRDPQNPNVPLLPDFINLRGANEDNYKLMAEAILDKGIPFDFDYITGIPTTGPNIGKPLAELVGKPYYDIIEKAGEETTRKFNPVKFKKGELRPKKGEKVLRVDDLITKMQTKEDAEVASVEGGFKTAGDSVLIDREEGGMDAMRKKGRKIVAVITRTELYAVAVAIGKTNLKTFEKMVKRIEVGKKNNLIKNKK
jgi:orotidine-5'-phosphate decarboxylase